MNPGTSPEAGMPSGKDYIPYEGQDLIWNKEEQVEDDKFAELYRNIETRKDEIASHSTSGTTQSGNRKSQGPTISAKPASCFVEPPPQVEGNESLHPIAVALEDSLANSAWPKTTEADGLVNDQEERFQAVMQETSHRLAHEPAAERVEHTPKAVPIPASMYRYADLRDEGEDADTKVRRQMAKMSELLKATGTGASAASEVETGEEGEERSIIQPIIDFFMPGPQEAETVAAEQRKVAVVVGASRGIGFELARALCLSHGYTVLATIREKATFCNLSEMEHITVVPDLDVVQANSGRILLDALAGRGIDLLIYNAGAGYDEEWSNSKLSIEEVNVPQCEHFMNVNAFGAIRILQAVSRQLNRNGKVALMSSSMASMEGIGENHSGRGGYHAFRLSKVALNMVGSLLNTELLRRGVYTVMLHPGMVATRMTGWNGMSAEHCATSIIARIQELNRATSGRFIHAGTGEDIPW